MGSESSSEILITTYQTIRHQNSEGCYVNHFVKPIHVNCIRTCNLSLPQEIHVVLCFPIEHTLAQPRRNDGS